MSPDSSYVATKSRKNRRFNEVGLQLEVWQGDAPNQTPEQIASAQSSVMARFQRALATRRTVGACAPGSRRGHLARPPNSETRMDGAYLPCRLFHVPALSWGCFPILSLFRRCPEQRINRTPPRHSFKRKKDRPRSMARIVTHVCHSRF